MPFFSDRNRLAAARRIFEYVGKLINVRFSIRLWDGSMIPLSNNVNTDFFIAINGPGVIGSLMRWPTYENLLLHYIKGHIDIHGDMIDFFVLARDKKAKGKLKEINKFFLFRQALPLLLTLSGK